MRENWENFFEFILFYMNWNFHSARYAYENCIFNSAKHKCKPESASFTKKLAELLSAEKQFNNCDKIQDHICSAATRNSLNSNQNMWNAVAITITFLTIARLIQLGQILLP